MRRIAVAVAVAALLVVGCGGSEKEQTPTTTTQPARSTVPKNEPGGNHPNRPPGSVYNDEIGENVVTVPRDRVIKLFGAPATTRGRCIRYRIVKQPKQRWEFCFNGQKMTSAMVVPAH